MATNNESETPCHPTTILRTLQKYLSSHSNYGHGEDQLLTDFLEENFDILIDPSPFHVKPRNSSDRQAIMSGKVAKYPDLPPLSEEQKLGIFSISDMYNLNEIVCLDYWIAASDSKTRRWLEKELQREPYSYDNQLISTVITLYEHDRLCLIDTLGLLFKSRHDISLHDSTKHSVEKFTNKMLQKGVIGKVIDSLKKGLAEKSVYRAYSYVIDSLTLLAENLFLITYQVQLNQSEYQEISNLIQSASDILSADSAAEKTCDDWKLNSVLVLLQVTQLSVLEQTYELYHRDGIGLLSEGNKIGNTLLQVSESKDKLDEPWKGCKGVKGVACLAHAVLRQPLVDIESAPTTDVIWFLQEASQKRAYSYLRLCIIPALQSRAVGSVDVQPLLCGVVCELIENIITIISLPLYRFHPESGFPFFPDEQIASDGSLSDTFEDFLLLIHDFAGLWPAISDLFWNDEDSEESGGIGSGIHPFLKIVAHATSDNQLLLPSAWRFLASLSGGPSGEKSAYLYNFLRQSHRYHELNWSFLFTAISNVATTLSQQSSTSGVRHVDGIGSRVVAELTSGLGIEDQDSLLAILELISSVVRTKEVANQMIVDGYQPIAKISALISCIFSPSNTTQTVPSIEIRGRTFQILSFFAKIGTSSVIEEIWDALETHHTLPLKSNGVKTISDNRALASWRGVREDLEDAETTAKKYPVTDSYLQLLHSLILGKDSDESMNIPSENAVVYLEYVVEDVLLKLSSREYSPNGPAGRGQKYRLITRCFSILSTILQQYDISSKTLSTQFQDDFKHIHKHHRTSLSAPHWHSPSNSDIPAKSPGYQIMTLLLGKSKLLASLFEVLGSCTPDDCRKVIESRWEEVSKDSIDIMRQTRPERSGGLLLGISSSIWSSTTFQNTAEPDLSSYTIASTSCDCSYWQTMAATTAIGLLYECMNKSHRFMELFRSANGVPTAMEPHIFGSSIHQYQPVQGFAEVMCTVSAFSSLVKYIPTASVSTPSAAVMAIQIINHVICNAPQNLVLGILMPSTIDEDYLRTQLIACLLRDVDDALIIDWNTPQPLGGSVSLNHYSTLKDRTLGADLSGSRGAVLALLQATLNSSNKRIGYYLLGLRFWTDSSNSSPHCLDAILTLLDTKSDCLFVSDHPAEAIRCYELIYTLCLGNSSDGVSATALDYLRSRDFINQHLSDLARQWTIVCSSPPTKEGFQLKTTLLECVSYLMRLSALDIRAIRFQRPQPSKYLFSTILLLLTGDYREHSFDPESSSNRGVLLFYLIGLFESDVVLSQQAVSSIITNMTTPTVLRLLEQIVEPLTPSKKNGLPSDIFHIPLESLKRTITRENETSNSASFVWSTPNKPSQGSPPVDYTETSSVSQTFNQLQFQLLAAIKLSSAFQQLVSVLFSSLQDDLASLHSTADRSIGSTVIARAIDDVLLPLTHVIATVSSRNTDKFSDVSISIIESLSLSVLPLVNGIFSCLSSGDPESFQSVLSIDSFSEIVSALILSIKSLTLRGPQASLARSYLHVAVTKCLYYAGNTELNKSFGYPSRSLSTSISEEDKSSLEPNSRERIESVLQRVCKEALTPVAEEFAEVLCKDIVDGELEIRLTSMAVLTQLLSSLVLSNNASTTPKFESVVSVIVNRGYVASLLQYIESNPTASIDRADQQELFRSAIGVCRQLALSEEGSKALLGTYLQNGKESDVRNHDILSIILALHITSKVPPLDSTYDMVDGNTDGAYVELTVLPILQLLVTLGTASNTTSTLSGISAIVIKQWQSFVNDVMVLRLKSPLGWKLLDILLQLINILALGSKEVDLLSANPRIIRDANQLLGYLGKEIATHLQSRTAIESENEYQLKILAHLATFYRIRTGISNQTSGNQLYVDTRILVDGFTECGESYLSVVSAPYALSIRGNDIFLASCRFVCENLICGIANVVNQQLRENMVDVVAVNEYGVLKAITLAEKFPSSSFVRQVGRWLRDHTY